MPALKIEFWIGLGLIFATMSSCADPVKNGFDLEGALVPADEIVSGGPPRDGIPAIDDPRFIEAEEAEFLSPTDRVLGMVRHGIAKAYPIAILNWHEIVNDEFAGEPVAVTYCPLTASGIAYPGEIDGKRTSFGTSGLLYNGNLVMYDRTTESLWSQLMSRSIDGPMKGRRLESLPLSYTSWAEWRARHPDTRVLSTDTGYRRDYGRDPYAGHARSARVPFPLSHYDDRYHPKALVLGVALNGETKAYPFEELAKTRGEIQDSLGGHSPWLCASTLDIAPLAYIRPREGQSPLSSPIGSAGTLFIRKRRSSG
ncbi:DUF3179 domain-containing protein [Methylohalobius crimeensis]|uniref:DUF3179 domain-containing protein n=1 Tax=Methylohalobius crimeensis TaxID=244365 RepID=UPI00190F1B10|nr:DUF3179 domain-containing protein [Methylohalobius crimeensis]